MNLFDLRLYDPESGRWTTMDPARQYPSGFVGMGNNPVIGIDPDGSTVKTGIASQQDSKNGTHVVQNTINDLEEITGLILFEDMDGNLQYVELNDSQGNSTLGGSQLARTDLKNAIDDPRTLSLVSGNRSAGSGLSLMLGDKQIRSFISGTSSNLNAKTLGYGMTFMHELQHTDLGMNIGHTQFERSTYGFTGAVVEHINKIRSELGPDFGQRMSYASYPSSKYNYIPFDVQSLLKLPTNVSPRSNYQFIKF